MSAQLGRWNMNGQPVDPSYLEKAKQLIAPYGPDGEGVYIKDSVAVLFHAFHTTKESRRETQPFVTPSGAVLCWDGRLDNRAELINGLKDLLTSEATDVEVVAAAYELWGTECFANLIGDWALAIWNPSSRSLLLAKDFLGTRQLYYSIKKDQVTWSTILDPLVLLAGKTLALEEEYIAGLLSFFPATHLTPYVGIHAVPPSCFIRLASTGWSIHKYWDFDPGKRIRYRTDREYEEHFRQVFGEAVRRRLRSDSPVLAELSGGMDSSSIVCMADALIARGAAETPRLDTLSYYDDREPNWDERRYFSKVEAARGRSGCHIDVSSRTSFNFNDNDNGPALSPASCGRAPSVARCFLACFNSQKNRVLLSGTGGDEVLGGVPTPIPELADSLTRAKLKSFTRQIVAWALIKKTPLLHLLFETLRAFLPVGVLGPPRFKRPAPWVNTDFIKRNRHASGGYETRLRFLGPLPSFQVNLATLDFLRRQLLSVAPPREPLYEKRYPYLDRSLLEFLYAIPREQLLRPGQRRSLMRRAMAGIVPKEVLERKRKAFAARGAMAAIAREWPILDKFTEHMISDSLGIVVQELFHETLRRAQMGQQVPMVTLMRSLGIEVWLRSLPLKVCPNGTTELDFSSAFREKEYQTA